MEIKIRNMDALIEKMSLLILEMQKLQGLISKLIEKEEKNGKKD
jgi:hypothetical protein